VREKLVYKVRSLLVQAGVVVVCARGRARALAASSVWHTLFRRVMPDRRARDLEARGRGLHRGHNRERRVRVLLLLLLRVDHLRRGRLAPHRRGGTRHAPRRRRQKQGQGRAWQTASGLYGRRGTLGRRCLLRMCVQRSGDSEKEVFFAHTYIHNVAKARTFTRSYNAPAMETTRSRAMLLSRMLSLYVHCK